MRRIGLVIAAAAGLVGSYAIGLLHSSRHVSATSERHVLYYVDPMHPAYKSDRPGTAPDCGMPLRPVYADNPDLSKAASPRQITPVGAVIVDTAAQQLLHIQAVSVEKKSITEMIRAAGRVVQEETRTYRLNAGVDGFIRETYNDSVGEPVKRGQKLATYYAPDFLAVASGFLAAVERMPGAVGTDGSRTVPYPGAVSKQGVSSIQGYRDRLLNLGMSDLQINRMAEIRQLPESIDVIAPAEGFIVARNISAGQHFEHGMEFYRIVNLERVWVVAEVEEEDVRYLHAGAPAEVSLKAGGVRLPAHITESLPQSEAGGGTVKLRLEVENPGFTLRPDMLVDVDFRIHLPPAITVPSDALIDSGEGARVYVRHGDNIFEPREVRAGFHFGDRVQIVEGVQPGELVAVGASFLVDSESRLKAPSTPSPLDVAGGRERAMPGKTMAKQGRSLQVRDPDRTPHGGGSDD